jgi:hypothetical protein
MQLFRQLFLPNSETLTHSLKKLNSMHFFGKKFGGLENFAIL